MFNSKLHTPSSISHIECILETPSLFVICLFPTNSQISTNTIQYAAMQLFFQQQEEHTWSTSKGISILIYLYLAFQMMDI